MNFKKNINPPGENNIDSNTNFLSGQKDKILVLLDNHKVAEIESPEKACFKEGMIVEENFLINNSKDLKNEIFSNLLLDLEDEYLVKEEEYGGNLNFKDEKIIQNVY